MSRKRIGIALVVAALILGAVLFFVLAPERGRELVDRGLRARDQVMEYFDKSYRKGGEERAAEEPPAPRPTILKAIPKPEAPPVETARELPPSPPLPEVPEQATQEERKQAFELHESVDHIVRKDEPFEIDGKSYTIGQIQGEMKKPGGARGGGPGGAEGEAPDGKESPYYGVRTVRAKDNVWKIHFAILREYLARRQVVLPPDADKPLPGGRSSGPARALKFMESVVTVYNVDAHRVEKNINIVQPGSVILFFKISELFGALDKVAADDWKWLRYVKGALWLERPEKSVELIDRRSLAE